MLQRFDEMDQRLDKMDQRLDKMDQRLDIFQKTVEDGFAQINLRLNAVETRLASLEHKAFHTTPAAAPPESGEHGQERRRRPS